MPPPDEKPEFGIEQVYEWVGYNHNLLPEFNSKINEAFLIGDGHNEITVTSWFISWVSKCRFYSIMGKLIITS
jgi:hypothetical protein